MTKSRAARARRAKSAPMLANGRSKSSARPYASISTTWLAARRTILLCREHPVAGRLLLFVHANFTPGKPLPLPWFATRTAIRVGGPALADALSVLGAVQLLVKTREAVQPNDKGEHGRAAEYQLALRRKGESFERQHGDRNMQGYLRAWSDDLRHLARSLSDAAIPVWFWIAGRDRRKDGGLQRPFEFTAADIVQQVGLCDRTARRAAQALVDIGEAVVANPARGRAPATFAAAGILANGKSKTAREKQEGLHVLSRVKPPAATHTVGRVSA